MPSTWMRSSPKFPSGQTDGAFRAGVLGVAMRAGGIPSFASASLPSPPGRNARSTRLCFRREAGCPLHQEPLNLLLGLALFATIAGGLLAAFAAAMTHGMTTMWS